MFFSRKLVKIAENSDHNIDPLIFFAKKATWTLRKFTKFFFFSKAGKSRNGLKLNFFFFQYLTFFFSALSAAGSKDRKSQLLCT
jgi:hypothetical protein